jgi:flagellar biosynthesis protein FlhG
MLRDHAAELRKLARHALSGAEGSFPTPCVVSLAGGRPGVGVTTIAINLAVGLTELGARVVLVDANLRRADLPKACGVRPAGGVEDILADRRDVHEVLVAGPAGIHLLPGTASGGAMVPDPFRASRRLWRQIQALGRHAEVVLLDSGAGPDPHLPGIWQAADLTVVVTTPDHGSVTETYATVKQVREAESRWQLIVNRAATRAQAEEVHDRLARACQRFLARELPLLGQLPEEPFLADSSEAWPLLILDHPESSGAVAFAELAESLQPQLGYRQAEARATSGRKIN